MSEKITEQDKKNILQACIFSLSNEQKFYGALLQEFTMKYSTQVPTAGVRYNPKLDGFEIYINPQKFCLEWTPENRVAVMQHEILHFTNKHLTRVPFVKVKPEDQKLYNIAGDMSINQYIKNLPDGAVNVADWKMKDDKGVEMPFPLWKTMEEYFDLIRNNSESNKEMMSGYKEFDVHDWEQLDEETKKKLLAEARKMLKRTIEKTANSYTTTPDSVKDLLEELESQVNRLNYKSILASVIKKTVSSTDRESTWKRGSKRYGILAPGTRVGQLPRLKFYGDSSGSMSHVELNDCFNVLSNFLAVGSRECQLSLWHTQIYNTRKFKLHDKMTEQDIESGGTDIQCVIDDINRVKPDLSVVFTDGYFNVPADKIKGEVVWIISRSGNRDKIDLPGKYFYLDDLR